jgi:hypothetical protein
MQLQSTVVTEQAFMHSQTSKHSLNLHTLLLTWRACWIGAGRTAALLLLLQLLDSLQKYTNGPCKTITAFQNFV